MGGGYPRYRLVNMPENRFGPPWEINFRKLLVERITPASGIASVAILNASSVSRARRIPCRAHRFLAFARGGQHSVKGWFRAEGCEQRIGEQIRVRAIVLLDRALQKMERGWFLAAVPEERSLVIPRLGIGFGGQSGFRFPRDTVKIRRWPQLQTRLQQIAVIARRRRHELHRLARFGNLPFPQKERWHDVCCPLRTRVQTDKICGAFRLTQFHECPSARTKEVIARIERERGVALTRRLLQHPGITIDIAHGKVGLGTLRTALDQRLRRLIRLAQFAALHAVGNQLSG